MADFNQVLEPGDYKNGNINVVIEIPTGSNHKIEWDRKRACFMLQPLTTGIYVKARILGVMKFVDDGEVDDKIIAVVDDDRNNGDCIKTLEDLPKRTIEQIEFHFNHYKDLKKPGTTHVKGFFGLEEAIQVIEDATKRF